MEFGGRGGGGHRLRLPLGKQRQVRSRGDKGQGLGFNRRVRWAKDPKKYVAGRL